MVSMNISVNTSGYCTKCARKADKNYLLENKLLPIWFKDDEPQFHIPEVLLRLSHAEKMLIQRVSPFVPLHHIKQGVFGLSGHVCAFEQVIDEMVNILPRVGNDTGVIRVMQVMKTEIGSAACTTKAFRVRRGYVLDALAWLKVYNKEYTDIVIDGSRLDWLDGDESNLDQFAVVVDEVVTNHDNNVENADMGPSIAQCVQPRVDNSEVQAFGLVDDGGPGALSGEDQLINSDLQNAIRAAGTTRDTTMDWPDIKDLAVSEYGSTRIFARAFPWLFPGGFGDIKDFPNHEKAIPEWGRRLLYYEDGRFCKDKIFCFFAMNYIIRHRNSSSGKFFIEKFQRNVPDTLDELKEEIRNGNTSFVNHLTYYNKRIKGSSPYWFQKRAELYAWINQHIELGNGAPTFFITLSCAEYFWPDVIDLLRDRFEVAGIDDDDCYIGSPKLVQMVNDYSIVIQEYFQQRTIAWLETVGMELFDIKHYWIRYEFAPGRGQIHAHLLAIPNNHDISELCHSDMKQENGNQLRANRLAAWAETKFGLTASVDDGFDDREKPLIPPVSIRFSDLGDDDDRIHEDGQQLLHYCELHQCSGFCLRPGHENRYAC
jgi:hypothetical protein